MTFPAAPHALSPCRQALARLGRVFLLAALLGWAKPASAASYRPGFPDLFERATVLRVEVLIPEAGLQTLREPRRRRDAGKPQTSVTVRAGGEVFTNVVAQLKGFSSFQPVDSFPSLTLDFAEKAKGQRFFGLKKISLNNSEQDETRLHEKLSRELFAAAGVPVPRSDFAVVTLNGRELGLYVLTEGFDRDFLRRHFARADGAFYEPGVLSDLDRPMRRRGEGVLTNAPAVRRVVQAARETDPARRWEALVAAVDMERFLSMMAVETLLCHSDSYSMNRNNYRLYHDPTSGRLVFLPHGMDRILGTHRSNLELPVVPPALGLVARAVLDTAEGRRRYVERVGEVLTNQFMAKDWSARIEALQARLLEWKTNAVPSSRAGRWSDRPAEDGQELARRFRQRLAEAQLQLREPAEWWTPSPLARPDTNGLIAWPQWRLQRTAAQPQLGVGVTWEGSRVTVRGSNSLTEVRLGTRVRLPPGNYWLHGQVQVEGAAGETNSVTVSLTRYSTSRFDVETQRQRGPQVLQTFTVGPTAAPEEIEFKVSVRTEARELRLDLGALRLNQRQVRAAPNALAVPGTRPRAKRPARAR